MSPKKPKIKTEPQPIRKPKARPKCPIHDAEMEYQPERGIWKCVKVGCKQAAFPPEVVEKGKPILGSGNLELVLVKDPDGNKRPRVLLRTVQGNVMLDITNYVTSVTVEGQPDWMDQSSVAHYVNEVKLELTLFDITDTR